MSIFLSARSRALSLAAFAASAMLTAPATAQQPSPQDAAILESRYKALDERLAAMEAAGEPAVDIDPFSRDKAIAALKSLDALIGDLQKARSDA